MFFMVALMRGKCDQNVDATRLFLHRREFILKACLIFSQIWVESYLSYKKVSQKRISLRHMLE